VRSDGVSDEIDEVVMIVLGLGFYNISDLVIMKLIMKIRYEGF